MTRPLIYLTDVPTRPEIEDRHVELLLEHDLQHLDLHEITTSGRAITQTIAVDLLTEAPAPSGSRRAWTATRASHSSRGAAPRAWRETPSRSPTRRPNRSSTSPCRGT